MLLAISNLPLGRSATVFVFLRSRVTFFKCYLIKVVAALAQNHFFLPLGPSSPSPQHRFRDVWLSSDGFDSECHVEVVEADNLHDNIAWSCDDAECRVTRTTRRISWRVASWCTAEQAAGVFGGNCPGWDSRQGTRGGNCRDANCRISSSVMPWRGGHSQQQIPGRGWNCCHATRRSSTLRMPWRAYELG